MDNKKMYIKTNPTAITDRRIGDMLFGNKDGENIATYFITHNSQFHADEIFCTAAMLLAANKGNPYAAKWEMEQMVMYHQMIRVPNMSDLQKGKTGVISYDLQGSLFDHHDKSKLISRDVPYGAMKMTGDKHPVYSSFGILWNCIGLGDVFNIDGISATQDNVKDIIDRDIVYPIDCIDNYGPGCGVTSEVACLISGLNDYPTTEDIELPYEAIQDFDDSVGSVDDVDANVSFAFVRAVFMAIDILAVSIHRAQKFVSDVKFVLDKEDELGKESNGIKFLEIPKAPDGEKPITISLAAMNETPYRILVNRNPSDRDGTFRMISSKSDEISFGEKCAEFKGVGFRHTNGFLLTFDTEEHLDEFISKMILVDGVITPRD